MGSQNTPKGNTVEWSGKQLEMQRALAFNVGPVRLTIEELCAAHDMAVRTFYTWRKKPGWQEAINEMVRAETDASHSAILDACIRTAMTAGREGTADRKLYFQLRGDIGDGGVTVKQETHVHEGEKTLTPEQALRRVLAEDGGGVADLVRRAGLE